MKVLLSKRIIYFSVLLMLASMYANAQSNKIADMKWKNNFLMHLKQYQSAKNPSQDFGLKINPFWQDVNAPHVVNNSHIREVKIPSFNTIWASVDYDTAAYIANSFIRSTDGGKRWRLDSVGAPYGYGISGIAPLDANTCYAAMFNAFPIGGGMFKTTDGGDTWKQVEPGKLFGGEFSFPDIVTFFDAQHGVTIGDDDQIDSSRLEIYTTSDAGNTWQRVSKKNIPQTTGFAFSSNINAYAVFQNTIWVTAGDTNGNSYIYRSDDYGEHWQLFPYTLPTPITAFAFSDKQHGLGVSFNFGGATGEVETHDGGKTWANKNVTGYPMGLAITVIPSTHTYVSAMPYGSAPVTGSSYSNDFGATWKLIDTSSNYSSFAVAFLNPLIGWSGRADSQDPNGGMYKWIYNFSLDNNDIAAYDARPLSDNAIAVTKSTTGLSIYPNPVSNAATISFTLLQPQNVSLQVFDGSGRLIKNIANSSMEAGTHQLTWNASDENGSAVAKGIYYLKFNSGSYTETKKIGY
jgi:photosystem II stability/assembly factor-like uncharacterized protein